MPGKHWRANKTSRLTPNPPVTPGPHCVGTHLIVVVRSSGRWFPETATIVLLPPAARTSWQRPGRDHYAKPFTRETQIDTGPSSLFRGTAQRWLGIPPNRCGRPPVRFRPAGKAWRQLLRQQATNQARMAERAGQTSLRAGCRAFGTHPRKEAAAGRPPFPR